LKKRTKKLLLASVRVDHAWRVNKQTKVFCFFFSKKKYFLASQCVAFHAGWLSRRIFVLMGFAAAFWKRVERRIGLLPGYNSCRVMHGLVSIRLNNERMGGRRVQRFAV
jgi:hypothetical protein